MTKLSIMIPTISSRQLYYEKIMFKLEWQRKQLPNPNDVEIVTVTGDILTTGAKRNLCIDAASGLAMSFVDDDDDVTDCYLKKGLEFVDSGKDVASLVGLYFSNGRYDRPFIHKLSIKAWSQDDKYYWRCPNHLNFVKRDLVKHVRYQDKIFGEDGNWSMDVMNLDLLKTEFEIKETLYLYYAGNKPF